MLRGPVRFAVPRDRAPMSVAGIVLAAGVILAVVGAAREPYFFALYGDASSRLVKARMMVDSPHPGLHWLGTGWLPLPQLLFLPVSLVDALFSTGLAGAVVCLPLLAWATALLCKVLLRVTGDRVASALAALLVALNPNMLYVSLTAMTETITLFFGIAAVWLWLSWIDARDDARSTPSLLLGCLSAAAATLCRYEAWPFTVVGSAGIAVSVVASRGAARRTGALLGVVALSFVGMALWLVWHAAHFGDPLHFAHAEHYSAAWQAKHRAVRDTYYLRPWESLGIYRVTMVAVFGRALLIVAALGTALLPRRRPAAETLFLSAILLAMPVCTLAAVYLGIAEMTRWWNSRFVLLLAPFLAVALAVLAAEARAVTRSPRLVYGVLIVAFALTTASQVGGRDWHVVTLVDAERGFHDVQTADATAIAEWLGREWRSGMVLCVTGSAEAHRIIQPSGIATRHFVTVSSDMRRLLDPAIARDHFTWVILGRAPSADGVELVRRWNDSGDAVARDFDRVEENASYIVYRRKAARAIMPAPRSFRAGRRRSRAGA
jgi:hypothetical protein